MSIAGEMKRLLKRLVSEADAPNNGSIAVNDQVIIESFVANPDNTFLVSFPRTGSHWLRMIMELYFGRPSLVRVFYYPERRDYLTLHTHDLELDAVRSHVIYLYRDPIDTVYSQLQYHKEDIDDRERVACWSDFYGRHLDKWLHQETFTRRKTVVRYERLKADMVEEFHKICEHFDSPLDVGHLEAAAARVTKGKVKEKTPHDLQVVNLNQVYEEERRRFRKQYGEFVWQVLLNGREQLRQDF
jgi:hypothetical protein